MFSEIRLLQFLGELQQGDVLTVLLRVFLCALP